MAIVVAVGAAAAEREAADELARVLGRMSGLQWTVQSEGRGLAAGFYVGRTAAAARLTPPLRPAGDLLAPKEGEIGPDGFRVWSDGERVFLEGATPAAAYFAVSWLLQRHAGVRWYLPGEIGEVVPRRTEWVLPALRAVREPAYVSREVSGLDAPAAASWARRNGLAGRLDYNHALQRLFSADVFAAHPQWAPVVKGLRVLPSGPGDYHWQPDLSLPEVADFAGRAALGVFAAEPGRASYSLAVNDTVRFDQSAGTRALVEPLRHFRGRPDYSPLVFTFMNRAAAVLANVRSDRYLGCLAYFWCENLPPFPVHPQVLPYLTADRCHYYDERFRAEDLRLMSRWGGTGVRAFGLWEYAYGASFLIPRVPHGALAEAVHEGWLRGARGYLAEVGPQWGFDAFKTWMLTQLLWEPERGLAELADDFFPGFYGPAARPMRRFFVVSEQQWVAQAGPPYWIKFYQQEDQGLLFPPEACRRLRGYLEEARQAAAGDPVLLERVGLTARAFAVTERYVAFDGLRRQLAAQPGSAVAEGPFAALVGDWLAAEAQLGVAVLAAEAGPWPARSPTELAYFVRNDPVPRGLAVLGRREAAAPARVLATVARTTPVPGHWRALAEALAAGQVDRAPNLARNGRFDRIASGGQQPEFLFPKSGPLPADWEVRAMAGEAERVGLTEATADGRGRWLRIEGAWDTQVYQWAPAVPGQLYVASALARGRRSSGGDAALFLSFLGADGRPIGIHRMQSLPLGESSALEPLVLADLAPDGAAWVGLGIGASRQIAGDRLEATGLELRAVGRPR